MSEYNIDIADMQCWVFRMAQSKWKMSPSDCAELFKKYDILGFISECYDILHLNGYACVLHDVETLLKIEVYPYDRIAGWYASVPR